jgi:hypothetical protein
MSWIFHIANKLEIKVEIKVGVILKEKMAEMEVFL